MKEKKAFDVIVIGGGPGGYVAAIRAAQLGAKVLLIDKDRLGGTCLNQGCIPTKAMLADARLYDRVKLSTAIKTNGLHIDMKQLTRRKDKVVKKLVSGIDLLIKNNGIIFVHGKAKFLDERTTEVEGPEGKESFEGRRIIIATGSISAVIPNITVDGKTILTSTEMLNLSSIPKDLIIIGGGYIGMEFACLFSSLGSKVTVIEMLPEIIPTEDEEIVRGLRILLRERNIEIHTKTKVKEARVKKGRGEVTAINPEGKEQHFYAEKVLLAVGRAPCTDGLQLEKIKVAANRSFVKVNERMETTVRGIYAIGDVTGRQMLAHKASAEGIVAAENAMGLQTKIVYDKIPSCIFTFPEVASVGLTEKEAGERGFKVNIGRFPFESNGRALATGSPNGFVKVIADQELGQVIGIHILGDHATDLIGSAALALALEATTEEVGKTIQAHPTLMEAVAEASLDAMKESIHLPKKIKFSS